MSEYLSNAEVELLECSKINFENLERAFPLVKDHPFYKVAKAQLDEALGYGTVEDQLKVKSEAVDE